MSRWPTVNLGEVVQINPRPGTGRPPPTLPVAFVPMAAVCERNGNILSPETRLFGEVAKGFSIFAENDVLFAKITPCMENGKAAIAQGLKNQIGAGSTEFFVLRSTDRVLPEFVFYFIRRESFRQLCKVNFTGSAGQQRVPKSFLERVPLPLPPLEEQRRIVRLLDRAAEIRRRADSARDKARAIIPALFLDMFGDPAVNPKGWPIVTVGDLRNVTSDMPGVAFPDTMIALRVSDADIAPAYLSAVWSSDHLRAQIYAAAKTTNGTFKISQSAIVRFSFPLPPRQLQSSLAEQVRRIRALATHLDAAAAKAETMAAALSAQMFDAPPRNGAGDGA